MLNHTTDLLEAQSGKTLDCASKNPIGPARAGVTGVLVNVLLTTVPPQTIIYRIPGVLLVTSPRRLGLLGSLPFAEDSPAGRVFFGIDAGFF